MSWYKIGTITVNNGSSTVTGSGTAWIANTATGEAIYLPDGKLYEIAAVSSNTSITLAANYGGSTLSGQSYTILPSQSYIRDLATQAATLVNSFGYLENTIGDGKFADGTLAAPGVSFVNDTDTGIRRTASGTFALVSNGADVATIAPGGITLITPALGTPASGTLTLCTGLPVTTGVSGLGTGIATFLATPSSANLAAAVTNETGSGSLVFATSPTLVTPALGTPASGVVTNLTGTASININGTVGGTTPNVGIFTESNLAAVSSSLPPLTFVDSCFHFAKNDTDLGAWRKRKGQSWRSETIYTGKQFVSAQYANDAAALAANPTIAVNDIYFKTSVGFVLYSTGTTIYRGSKEDYPTNALITAEATRVIIWDLDSGSPKMWMVFVMGVGYYLGGGAGAMVSVSTADGSLAVGTANNGVMRISFHSDKGYYYSLNVSSSMRCGPVSLRNSNSGSGTLLPIIVGNAVDTAAITVLPNAPYDEFGMPIPTIAVATSNGISVIKDDGTVKNSASTTAAYGISFDSLGRVVWNTTTEYNRSPVPPLSASFTASSATEPKLSAAAFSSSNVPITPAISTATGKSVHGAIASTNGLTLHKVGQSSAALHAAVTSTYNTGWLIGDIRRAFLANSKTADRSIKAGTLTEVGTVTETVNAGGRNVYSGFSASNYLQEASHADWNALGTGDFSIVMSGVKWGTAATLKTLLSVGDGASNGSIKIEHLAANTLRVSIYNSSWTTICTSSAVTDTAEHVLSVCRGTYAGVANTVQIIVDGVVVASSVSALTVSNASGYLRVGEGQGASQPWAGGQVSCVRISATAPTAEQSKYIAATENALNSGATCLLSNSSSVSELAYDNDTNTIRVGNGTNVDTFVGLKRIASQAHGVTTLTSISAANGRMLMAGSAGATYAAPVRNVGAELLESKVKLPREQQYAFTSSGTTQALPAGWKARGIVMNVTDGTFLAAAQTFDGFIWTLTGLTNAKAYQINLESL